MSRDLLLEVGTEEIPARFLDLVLPQLEEAARAQLKELRISFAGVKVYGTPRRLALVVEGLPERQADLVREVKGPARAVAFDEHGQPTRAAQGFARSQGVAVEDLQVRETEQGTYVFAVLREAGRPVADVLVEWLPRLVAGLHFPKSMRWGTGDLRFARPIRWLVALLGDEVLPVELEGLQAGRTTRGHRFLAPEPIPLASPAEYVDRLREAYVLVDPAERRQAVLEQVRQAAAQHGARAIEDPALVAEVTNLVEYPAAVVGAFDPAYLQLPREVLITPMREHQRYFPLVDDAGRLLPRFVAVSNGPRADMDLVRRGNEKVLAARLADARFFYEEDRRQPLAAYVERLREVVFQEQLGTVHEKMERIRDLTGWLADAVGADETTRRTAVRAAELAKADLVTQMVYEFPELQGVMGREYALLSGEGDGVAQAIYEHYLPRHAGDELPASLAGSLVSVADKLDTIVGCFGAGLIPTGSQDPYGLRRQALGVLRIAVGLPGGFDLATALAQAKEGYGARLETETDALVERIMEFFRQRLRGLMQEEGLRHDIVEAVLAVGFSDVAGAFQRARALAQFSQSDAFEALITAYQRAANLAQKGDTDQVEEAALTHPAEQALYAALQEVGDQVEALVAAADYGGALGLLATLRPHVDRLFEEVLVMAPEPAVRRNRLALLRRLVALCHHVADLGLIVA
ncbi:MAG TPA: glycine--tRNA ligase subunit beta [Limnochordales bacterium]|nr:glycine--tRNA ligase subunit beta [Limnochordales bacterium]